MIPFCQPAIELGRLRFRHRSLLRRLRRLLERSKGEILETLQLRRDINTRDEIGEIIRHRRLGLLKLLQLDYERAHENESGLVVFHQGRLKLFWSETLQPQLYGFDQAFVGKREKVRAVFRGELRRARRDIQQPILCFYLLAISQRKRVQYEMQVGVLDIVNGKLCARSHNDRVMVAEIAEVRAIAYE